MMFEKQANDMRSPSHHSIMECRIASVISKIESYILLLNQHMYDMRSGMHSSEHERCDSINRGIIEMESFEHRKRVQ